MAESKALTGGFAASS